MLAHAGAATSALGSIKSAPESTSKMFNCIPSPSAASGPSALRGRLLRGATISRGNSMMLAWEDTTGSTGSASLPSDNPSASAGRSRPSSSGVARFFACRRVRAGAGAEAGSGGLKTKSGSRRARKSSLSQASSEGGGAGGAGTKTGFLACLGGCAGNEACSVSNATGNASVGAASGSGKASGTAFLAT